MVRGDFHFVRRAAPRLAACYTQGMDEPMKWRFRFGLSGLLLLVAICAVGLLIYRWLPNYVSLAEVRSLEFGMDMSTVRDMLGEPDEISRREGITDTGEPVRYEVWSYPGVALEFKDRELISIADLRYIK